MHGCWEAVKIDGQATTNETKYSRMDQVKLFKGCLPQILLGPFLNTLCQMSLTATIMASGQLATLGSNIFTTIAKLKQ